MRTTKHQGGSVLIAALILMTLLTYFAVSSFKVGKGNLAVANNAQQHAQTMSAAQSTIDDVISTPQFSVTPGAAVRTPCGGVANTACVDVNGDGVPDVTVAVAPQCMSNQIIPNAALDLTLPDDQGCALGVSQDFGTAGASTAGSLCANLLWNIQATANDNLTKSQSVISQGVTLRTSASQVCP